MFFSCVCGRYLESRAGKKMTLNEYQKVAFEFNSVVKYYQRQHSLCGLVEEVGELNGKVKRFCRGDYVGRLLSEYDADIKKELGDILWYLADFCSTHGYSLDDIAKENIEKLEDRKQRGVIQGQGDAR